MGITITRKDILWGYVGYFLNFGTSLIMLPFIIRFLTSKELGLWYSFVSIGALVNLLDFGFSNTISRNINYAWCGARELVKEGLDKSETIDRPNFTLINEIVHVTRKIYWVISLIALFVVSIAGTFFIISITKDLPGYKHFFAWGVFCLAIFFNLLYNYWTSLLKGIGAIKEGQKAIVFARIFQLIITLGGLLLSWGLLAMTLGFLMSGFIIRLVSKRYYIDKLKLYGERTQTKNRTQTLKTDIFVIIWYNTWRFGLISLGAFLITQTNTILCSSFFGLESTAKYGLSLQLFSLLGGIGSTVYVTLLPELNQACLHNDNWKIKNIISISVVINWTIYLSGILLITLLGDQVFSLLHSKVTLLPLGMLILMGTYLFLENNHSMFSAFITSENRVPFVNAALISGFAIVILSSTLGYYTQLGLWGLLLSQAIVQLAYNNWKWPYLVFRKYNLNLRSMISYSINLTFKKILF